MKNKKIWILTALLLWMLAGCGAAEDPEQLITMGTEPPAEETTRQSVETAGSAAYGFTLDGVTLVPGQPFDPAQLPEADAVFWVPSCAIEGMDTVYQYGDFEVTAVDDGTGAVVYSIYFLSEAVTTTEGLRIGDSAETMQSLYGPDFAQESTARIYSVADTWLIVILAEDHVSSIEYRWVP